MEDGIFSVLVVDDHPDASTLFKKSLCPGSAFPAQVDCALNIPEALEKIKTHVYDLLLIEADFHRTEESEPLLDCMDKLELPMPFVLMTPVRDDALFRAAKRAGIENLLVMSESHYNDLAEKLKKIMEDFKKRQPRSKTTPFFESGGDLNQDSLGLPDFETAGLRVDELTGIYTHSYFQQRVVEEFSRATRYNYPVSCLFLDIDHFKVVNEEKGYHAGDLLLRECANFLFENCRMSDLIARYGGTEFAILMPFSDYKESLEMAKRIRLRFSSHDFMLGGQGVNLSISIGVASFPEDTMSRRGDLIAFSRHALLRSKATGRNRVTQYRHVENLLGVQVPVPKLEESRVLEFQRKLSEVAELAKRGSLEAARALIQALEAKDKHTAGHGASCAKYARFVAETLGMSVEDCESIEQGALLHDIGKLCVSDEILLKPAKLTFEEYEKMKEHPYMGYRILKPIRFLREEALVVLHHHEWFNGEGYPGRLKGNDIPLGARIASVVDSFDTIRTAGARYKKTYPTREAVQELIRYAGTQFDPRVVKVFIDVLIVRRELTPEDYDKNLLEQKIAELPDKDAPLYNSRDGI